MDTLLFVLPFQQQDEEIDSESDTIQPVSLESICPRERLEGLSQ